MGQIMYNSHDAVLVNPVQNDMMFQASVLARLWRLYPEELTAVDCTFRVEIDWSGRP